VGERWIDRALATIRLLGRDQYQTEDDRLAACNTETIKIDSGIVPGSARVLVTLGGILMATPPPGPVITGPASAQAKIGQAVALPCKVSDPHWPTSQKVTCQVTAPIGTVMMTLNGKPVTGSGTASITMTDTVANVQAALTTLKFTA
jgi:hypothetical protein